MKSFNCEQKMSSGLFKNVIYIIFRIVNWITMTRKSTEHMGTLDIWEHWTYGNMTNGNIGYMGTLDIWEHWTYGNMTYGNTGHMGTLDIWEHWTYGNMTYENTGHMGTWHMGTLDSCFNLIRSQQQCIL